MSGTVDDAAGNRTAVTDGLNHTTTSAYDAYSRLASLTDPVNNVTSWGYDANNRVTRAARHVRVAGAVHGAPPPPSPRATGRPPTGPPKARGRGRRAGRGRG